MATTNLVKVLEEESIMLNEYTIKQLELWILKANNQYVSISTKVRSNNLIKPEDVSLLSEILKRCNFLLEKRLKLIAQTENELLTLADNISYDLLLAIN